MNVRRTFVGVAATVVAITVLTPAVQAHDRVRADLASVHEDLEHSQHRRTALAQAASSTSDERKVLEDELDTTSVEVWTRAGEAAGADADLVTLTGERDTVQGQLTQSTGDLAGALRALESVRQASADRAAVLGDLQGCLSGVSRSAGGLRSGDAGAAFDGLRSVSTLCARADAALTPGEDGGAAFPYDFADPFVLATSSGFYGYSTNGGGGHVQLIRSTDLRSWEWLGEAMPALPPWADRNRTWAPSVLARGSSFVLYYAARHRASGHQCISTATASRPEGPFVDDSAGPFLCQHEQGGSIDPSPFVDANGQAHLLWKSEGETVGRQAELWSAPLRGDGRALAGVSSALVTTDQRWEGRTVEGPSMTLIGGTYHLFYSANSWDSGAYGVGHATCSSPAGPCRKTSDRPALSSIGRASGAGGPEPLWVGDQLHLAFHAWTAPDVGYPNRRKLHVRPVAFDGSGRPAF